MKIELQEHTVREIVKGFIDNQEEGVIGFDGKLNIRPKYQREFIYDIERQKAVIRTIQKGFPLNVMYWVQNEDNTFELLDGQQRTLSICYYVDCAFSVENENNMPLSFDNLTKEEQEQILDYKLFIYVCQGTDKERLDWFRTINIAGLQLTEQELRNAQFTGEWLTNAKVRFSKNGCTGKAISDRFIKVEVNRQALLELALNWIANRDGISIDKYMADHQHDANADELWTYFRNVCDWVDMKFKKTRKEMVNQHWNEFYEKFKDKPLDATQLEEEISRLLKDSEVTNKKGIYPYVLYHDAKYLHLRTFDDDVKSEVYEQQKGICPFCQKEGKSKIHYELSEMQADHIVPWSKGGKTVKENCMMLCRFHNASKSDT